MVMDDDELSSAGVTVSQLPETVVVLVVNDTAAEGTVEKVTVCVKGVVEPGVTAGGVQAVTLGVTVGGAVPAAKMLPLMANVLTGPVPIA
jgi:hypothetical protein